MSDLSDTARTAAMDAEVKNIYINHADPAALRDFDDVEAEYDEWRSGWAPGRDELIDVLVMTDLSDYAGTDMGMIEQAADAVLALIGEKISG